MLHLCETWIPSPEQVTVEDIDECSLDPASPEAQCPGCRAACHEHAICENMVGTYTCKCPSCMSGDGFDPFIPKKSTRVPPGYEGGSGCRDSCRPVITLLGEKGRGFGMIMSEEERKK